MTQHIAKPDDVTVLTCKACDTQHIYTKSQMKELGVPWYCENCGCVMTKFEIYNHEELPQQLARLL